MFDYIKIEKFLHGKDSLIFDNLKHKGNFANNHYFEIRNGFNPLKVCWNNETGRLVIEGSMPYFMQGHNFEFSNQSFYECVEVLEYQTKTNLFQSDVVSFEFGKVLEVENKVTEIFNNHTQFAGMKRRVFENGIYFEDKVLKVKMYDCGYRIRTVCKPLLGVLRNNFDFDTKKHYLRFEDHYKKPEIHFKERNLKLERLFETDFQKVCQQDLLKNYQSIQKTKTLSMPTDKKFITSATLPILVMQELSNKYGFNAEEEIFKLLRSISSETLTKQDKSNRKSQIKENFEKLAQCNSTLSNFDLSEKLELAFY